MPGVRLVLTPDDPDIARLGAFTSKVRRTAPDGTPNFVPPYRSLSAGAARFVGDAVAAVVADTLAQAKDAMEAIVIDWDVLPAVTDLRAAVQPDAPMVWAEAPGNICFTQDVGDRAPIA
jgi:carbon-monoxide dehydrogenase large subunit